MPIRRESYLFENDIIDVRGEFKDDAAKFDYNSVPASVAKFLQFQADRIRRNCVTSILQIGNSLIGAKHYLSHGKFLAWVEQEVGILPRTAQAYMRVAQWASDKGRIVHQLRPSILYLLSASSTPKEFVDKVLERVEAGEHVGIATLRNELSASRESIRKENCNGATPAGQNVEDYKKDDSPSTTTGRQSVVMDAIAIMADGLSPADFTRVRGILMSKSVLEDPNFPHKIAEAFASVEIGIERNQPLVKRAAH